MQAGYYAVRVTENGVTRLRPAPAQVDRRRLDLSVNGGNDRFQNLTGLRTVANGGPAATP